MAWVQSDITSRRRFIFDVLKYKVYTNAIQGTLTTQFFGDNFDADKVSDKVDRHLYIEVYVFPPMNVRNNTNATLYFEIEKLSMRDFSTDDGEDTLYVGKMGYADMRHTIMNFTPPLDKTVSDEDRCKNCRFMRLKRHMIDADVKKQKLDTMPGFRFTWYYSGVEVEPKAYYLDTSNTKAFIRNFIFC